jgi:hypothetical protein
LGSNSSRQTLDHSETLIQSFLRSFWPLLSLQLLRSVPPFRRYSSLHPFRRSTPERLSKGRRRLFVIRYVLTAGLRGISTVVRIQSSTHCRLQRKWQWMHSCSSEAGAKVGFPMTLTIAVNILRFLSQRQGELNPLHLVKQFLPNSHIGAP